MNVSCETKETHESEQTHNLTAHNITTGVPDVNESKHESSPTVVLIREKALPTL